MSTPNSFVLSTESAFKPPPKDSKPMESLPIANTDKETITITTTTSSPTPPTPIQDKEREEEEDPSSSSQKRRTPIACVSCHRMKVSCDSARPCSRCVRMGRSDTCLDRPHKKKGRPPKEPSISVARAILPPQQAIIPRMVSMPMHHMNNVPNVPNISSMQVSGLHSLSMIASELSKAQENSGNTNNSNNSNNSQLFDAVNVRKRKIDEVSPDNVNVNANAKKPQGQVLAANKRISLQDNEA